MVSNRGKTIGRMTIGSSIASMFSTDMAIAGMVVAGAAIARMIIAIVAIGDIAILTCLSLRLSVPYLPNTYLTQPTINPPCEPAPPCDDRPLKLSGMQGLQFGFLYLGPLPLGLFPPIETFGIFPLNAGSFSHTLSLSHRGSLGGSSLSLGLLHMLRLLEPLLLLFRHAKMYSLLVFNSLLS